MDTISPGSGSYCEYFEQRFQKNSDIGFMAKETPSDNTAASCDIEESIIVRRSIEYPNTPKAQQDILKSLSKHLEENYSVRRIELEKTDRISQPGMKKYTEEIVTITIHGGADNGSYS